MVKRSYETDRSVLRAIINEPSTGGTAISSYTYGVNDLGQRESVSQAGTAFPTADAVDWGYDALGQVVSANATSLSANDRYYAFDSIGNRLQSRVATPISTGGTATDYYSEAPPTPTTIGANSLNQYGGIKVGTGPITAPTHDLDGNLTYDGTKWHYDWDGENRMISAYTSTSITSPARIDYAYDYLGRCYRRQVKSWNGSAWVLATTLGYLYDGWNRVAATSPSNTWNEELVWGLDLSGTSQGAGGVGGLLVWSRVYGGGSWESYYPTYDGNGNVSEMLNASGMVSAHWEYDAFGNTTYKTAGSWPSVASEFTYRFSTKPMDLHTGLYYYGYRYYDPVTGRWPSRDPIGEQGGINLYGFLANDAVSDVEVLGLIPLETIADVTSIGHSGYELYNDPTWGNFGYLAWDVAATVIPYAPGSYVAKGAKAADKANDARNAKAAKDAAEEAAKKARQAAERERKRLQQEMKKRQTEPNPHKSDPDPCKALCWSLKRAKDVLDARDHLFRCYPMDNDPHDHPGQIDERKRAVDNALDAVEKAGCKCDKYDFWNK